MSVPNQRMRNENIDACRRDDEKNAHLYYTYTTEQRAMLSTRILVSVTGQIGRFFFVFICSMFSTNELNSSALGISIKCMCSQFIAMAPSIYKWFRREFRFCFHIEISFRLTHMNFTQSAFVLNKCIYRIAGALHSCESVAVAVACVNNKTDSHLSGIDTHPYSRARTHLLLLILNWKLNKNKSRQFVQRINIHSVVRTNKITTPPTTTTSTTNFV